MPEPPPKTNDGLLDQYFNAKLPEFELDCSNGNASACFSLGEWWQMVGKDQRKAASLRRSDGCAGSLPLLAAGG